jgi:hypothetical protein
VILFAAMSIGGLAQHHAGPTPGQLGPSKGGAAWNTGPGLRGQSGYGPSAWPVVPWIITPGCAPPLFSAGISPFSDNTFCGLGPGPLMSPDPAFPMGMDLSFPGTYPSGVGPITNLPSGLLNPPQSSVGFGADGKPPTLFGGNKPSGLQQTPTPTPVVQDEYPPVILLKTGWAYSAKKYWKKKGSLYFVTTEGETRKVPIDLVDRIYPGKTRGPVSSE